MNKPITPMDTVGLDISEKYIHVCEISRYGEIEEEGRFRTNERALMNRYKTREECRFVIEVGSHSRWIGELLTKLEHEVLIVDPRHLALISGTLNKCDKVDAEMLAWLGANWPDQLKTVKLRQRNHQMALTLVRSRATLVKSRTLLVNAIRGQLKPYGVKIPHEGRSSSFVTFVRQGVEPGLAELFEPNLQVLEQLNAQIKAYDKRAEKMLSELAPDAMHLLQIDGVSWLTVLYFVALVGDPYRFTKTRSIGAYFGMTRRRDDSGDYESLLGITKAGDSYIRALLANCASYILGPFGKDSDLRRWGLRYSPAPPAGRKRTRAESIRYKKAKVAVARKLAVLMLALWKSGKDYDPLFNAKRRERRNASSTPAQAA